MAWIDEYLVWQRLEAGDVIGHSAGYRHEVWSISVEGPGGLPTPRSRASYSVAPQSISGHSVELF
jgi:hypothetical protein